MAENLLQPRAKDESPTWVKNKYGAVSCVPAFIAASLLKDKNKGFEICEPEFVPSKQIRPYDDDKKEGGNKRANTELTYSQVDSVLSMTLNELQEHAKEKGIDIRGRHTKKQILEALELGKKLY